MKPVNTPTSRLLPPRSTFLAPVFDPLTLPPEIAAQVFLYVIDQPPLSMSSEWVWEFNPLRFGRVCKAWRDFAWSMPELWSTVIIVLGTYLDWDDDVHVDLLTEWLHRAGTHRDLHIYLSRPQKPPSFRAWQVENVRTRMLPIIGSRSTQWATVAFRMPHTWLTYFDEFGRNVKLSCPRLQSFFLDDAGHPVSTDIDVELVDAPLLNLISFRNSDLITRGALKLPFGQITSIDILPNVDREFDLCEFLTPFLNVGRIHFMGFRVPRSLVPIFASHPAIRCLELTSNDNTIPRLLETLSLPALEDLRISALGKAPDLLTGAVLPFIDRSRCRLLSLRLNFNINNLKDEEDIYEFLCNLPDLKELYLRDPFHASTGLSKLFFHVLHPAWTESFVPFLEVFSYEGPLRMKPQYFLDPLLLRARLFMDNRYESDETSVASALRYVRLSTDQHEVKKFAEDPIDHETLDDLKELLETGALELLNRDGTKWELEDGDLGRI
ncbi:hypothetical protein CVT26_009558 [Gymnopilus dilepis]|uniref:Uncharacterized protein n=1 Tax=Gymnopilus dilepis TaxID=231916 RepID=A0A409VKA0_9AGAR|nr:hypothetical protein CVT26_009558 [Gymnopilus dilepis]